MQASKIKIRSTYAVRVDGELCRFIVKEVVTRRIADRGSPNDYKSTVIGSVVETGADLTVQPDAILGEYTAYQELLDRKRVEEEAREAKQKQQSDNVKRLLRRLYRIIGKDVPEAIDHHAPFSTSYSGIQIDHDGIALLLDKLGGEA